VTKTLVGTPDPDPSEHRDLLGLTRNSLAAAGRLREPRATAARTRLWWYVLWQHPETGVRNWMGPYATKRQARSAKSTLTYRRHAFLTRGEPDTGEAA
jgi:hypothetical protein